MRLLKTMRRQKAVYWSYAGIDNFGKPKYGAAVEVNVRWEDINIQYMRADMTEAMSSSVVYLGQDVLVKGVLWLSSKKSTDPAGSAIAELTDPVKPLSNPGAKIIQRFDKIPTVKADDFLRMAYM